MRHSLALSFSVDTAECSMSARISWCTFAAKELSLLDSEVIQLWMLGALSDRDLLDNIASHGDLACLRKHHDANTRHLAKVLTSEVHNLAQGLMLSEDGNYKLHW